MLLLVFNEDGIFLIMQRVKYRQIVAHIQSSDSVI